MRFKVAVAIAMFVAMAATTASAGIVITEKVVASQPSLEGEPGEQTVKIQGNKRRVITHDRVIITDLDGQKMYVLAPAKKAGADLALPPKGVVLAMMAKEGMSVELKKGAGTHKVAGYDCQDYEGTQTLGHYNLAVTECVASAAPGAKEYVAFMKAMGVALKGTPIEPKGEIPDGLPVSSTVTVTLIPFPIPKGFSPDLAAKVKAQNAKVKPDVTRTTVTKVEVKDIAASEFVLPAEYVKPKNLEMKSGVPGGPNPPIPAPEQSIPPGAMPPTPAAH
jgi:hypothetical protein